MGWGRRRDCREYCSANPIITVIIVLIFNNNKPLTPPSIIITITHSEEHASSLQPPTCKLWQVAGGKMFLHLPSIDNIYPLPPRMRLRDGCVECVFGVCACMPECDKVEAALVGWDWRGVVMRNAWNVPGNILCPKAKVYLVNIQMCLNRSPSLPFFAFAPAPASMQHGNCPRSPGCCLHKFH